MKKIRKTKRRVFLEREAPTSAEIARLVAGGYSLRLGIRHVEGEFVYRIEVFKVKGEHGSR